MIQCPVQLVDRVRPERVSDFWAVERGDAYGWGVDAAVVGDVGEVEALHDAPPARIERSLRRHRATVVVAPGGSSGLPTDASAEGASTSAADVDPALRRRSCQAT